MRKNLEDNGNAAPKNHDTPGSPEQGGRRGLCSVVTRVSFWAIVISLILHVAIITALSLFADRDPHVTRAEALHAWQNQKSVAQQKNDNDNEKRTVIAIYPVTKTERPKDAKYLAEQDQSTDKERRARLGAKAQPQTATIVFVITRTQTRASTLQNEATGKLIALAKTIL